MSAMEELVAFIRQQGNPNDYKGLQLAEMTGAKTAKIGDFELFEEDLYFSDRLLETYGVGKYSGPLKSGDKVVVCQISAEKYVVLARVVGE